MPTFSTGWVRPSSVVVQTIISTTPPVGPTPLPCCIIGVGSRKKLTTSTWASDSTKHNGVQITRGATTTDVFDTTNTLTASDMVITIQDQYGRVYQMKDSNHADGAWQLLTLSSGSNTIEWLGTAQPEAGVWYVVNYYIPKVAGVDYKPMLMSSLSDQYTWSGRMAFAATEGARELHGSDLINSVSWGATFAYSNGAGQWYSLELDPYDETTLSEDVPTPLDLTTEAGLKTAVSQALAKLLTVRAWLQVPMFPITTTPSVSAQYVAVNNTILTTIKQHVTEARSTSYQQFCAMLLGAPSGADDYVTDPTLLYTETAASLKNRAICYIGPSTAKYTLATYDESANKLTYTQVDVDGSVIAAAFAGVATNPIYDAGETLSGKEISGFDSIPDPFNTLQKNKMGTVGVMLFDYQTTGNPAVVMDLTTDQTSAVAGQLKYTKSGDYISFYLNDVLRPMYVNTRNLGSSTRSNIKNTVQGIFDLMKAQHIIDDYDPVSVAIEVTEKRQLNINAVIYFTPDIIWLLTNLGMSI